MVEGTQIWESIKADKHKTVNPELMIEVWQTTPWIVDWFSDRISEHREREMNEWCRDNFGPEAWPIHGKPGKWQRGCVTINGWCWYGFATKEMMDRFCEAWPVPESEKETEHATGNN